MSNSHATQLDYLLIAIALLVLAIFVPIGLSLLKKKPKIESKSEPESTPLLSEKPITTEQFQSLKQPLSAVVDLTEDEFNSAATIEKALKKTNESFFGRIKSAFSNQDKKKVIEEIEEVLYTSDLGPKTVQKLLSQVEQELSSSDMANLDKVKNALAKQMQDILIQIHESQKNSKLVSELLPSKQNEPIVLMVVGVNGAGKTTSIGKMTAQLAHQGFKVLVAAGDTFRAAAGGQLKVWTDRAASSKGHVEIFWPDHVTDPAAVAFDAVSKAKAQSYDYVILDTAGRLHTQAHLMDELKKVKRVMSKVITDAPHETWIVLDANSGQNALNQAQEFNKALEITGIILTKMDGTAKGGVALGVVDQLAKPIRLVGLGEKIGDLKVFEPQEYIESILG
ncbi:MAG: signal recognition particle-docking protein FtsY [Pseudobdellovibrio sp.]